MEATNLKHAKKHWCRSSYYFREMEEKAFGKNTDSENVVKYMQVEMYMGNRKIVMTCYNPEVIEVLSKALPKEKISVWFVINSRSYADKWYTTNTIKYVEIKRLIELEKAKIKYSQAKGFDFGSTNSDF